MVLLALCAPTMAQTGATQTLDIQTRGPYGQRPFDGVACVQVMVPYFKFLGYKVDGIEGFVYPKSLPRPLGAVKLMRKYHAGLDDHANFPESAAASMGSNGWTYDTNGTDWLGYVYPNTGSMPTIQ